MELHLRFAVQVCGGVGQKQRGNLEAAQNSAVRALSRMRKDHLEPIYAEVQLLIRMQSLEVQEQIGNNCEKGPKNLSEIDQGQRRNKEFATPRLALAWVKCLPLHHYNLTTLEMKESPLYSAYSAGREQYK